MLIFEKTNRSTFPRTTIAMLTLIQTTFFEIIKSLSTNCTIFLIFIKEKIEILVCEWLNGKDHLNNVQERIFDDGTISALFVDP